MRLEDLNAAPLLNSRIHDISCKDCAQMERNRTPKLLALTMITSLTVAFSSQSSGAAVPKVTTVPVPAGGKAMAAKTDAQGTIHLVFDTFDGPQYATSKDNGKTLTKPMALVDRASRKPGLEFITWDLAVSSDGAVHVALGNNAWKLKLPKRMGILLYSLATWGNGIPSAEKPQPQAERRIFAGRG